MLKVTITDTATEEKWTLQGRLVWPWVNELRANWAKRSAQPRDGLALWTWTRSGSSTRAGNECCGPCQTKVRNLSPAERHVMYSVGEQGAFGGT
jgi:hypothetical protein